MKKVFILDTNVLLNSPDSIFKFDDNDVVIPISVIEEIDTFKKDLSETGRNAREVSRILDRLRARGTLSSGVKLFDDRTDSGSLFVYLGHNMEILPELLVDGTDNHILAIALTLQEQFGETRAVIVITKDSNLRIKSDAFGIQAEDFEADKVDISHLYSGILTLKVDSQAINGFYTKREIRLAGIDIMPNQFVILEDENDSAQMVYGKFDAQEGVVRMLENQAEGVWGIYPRNIEQIFALEALLDDNIKLVTLSGNAGTGKTLLAIAAASLRLLMRTSIISYSLRGRYFLWVKISGFPGDLDEKLNPWMQPIYDNLELLLSGGTHTRQKRLSKSYQELINQGMLQVEPLTYIRGRSLPNIYFVVDESQNLTPHEIKTILTRAGEGTKIRAYWDPYQIDNPYIDSQNNGLTYVIEKFRREPIAAHVTLKKGERSELATAAATLL